MALKGHSRVTDQIKHRVAGIRAAPRGTSTHHRPAELVDDGRCYSSRPDQTDLSTCAVAGVLASEPPGEQHCERDREEGEPEDGQRRLGDADERARVDRLSRAVRVHDLAAHADGTAADQRARVESRRCAKLSSVAASAASAVGTGCAPVANAVVTSGNAPHPSANPTSECTSGTSNA